MIEKREYYQEQIISFYKTDERFGLLSNMKGQWLMKINDMDFFSSEAIYQCFRYPHSSELQQLIAKEKSPLVAKRIAYKYLDQTRRNWDQYKNNIMRLTLRIKYLQCCKFRDMLLNTNNKPIIEISKKDDYWGTLKVSDGKYLGKNVLGRLLMELRRENKPEEIKGRINYILEKDDQLYVNNCHVTYENITKFCN